jgi:hypothetical protein
LGARPCEARRDGSRARSALPTDKPTLAALIEALDPEVRAASDDVARTLIVLSLQQSPWA